MKEGEKPRILLVGDYSNFHATLGKGLRKLGYDVTVASDGSTFMECDRDIDITRRHQSKIGGALYAASLYGKIHRHLRGFDIVSFRDPQFLELKPKRIKWFFNKIVDANTSCFLSFLTTDVKFLDMLEAADSPLRYSEWFIDGKPNRLRIHDQAQWDGWHSEEMVDLVDTFYSRIKGTVTALYEYQLAAERIFPKDKVAYGGIPIDTAAIDFRELDRPKKVRLFLARDYRRQLEKGSDLLEKAARNIVARYPDKAEFIMLENVPRKQYLEVMRSCHVLLDQIYSYTPASMALEGMASGLTVVSGGEPEFYDFIGEKENFPVVNAPYELEPLEKCLENLIMNPSRLHANSRRGREFVEKHNSMETVARRFLDFWIKNG